MAYLSQDALSDLGFKAIGTNVQISDKASIYGAEQMSFGDNVRVDDFTLLSGRISFGRNVHIAVGCHIFGGDKGVTFEDFSGLSFSVNVFCQSDDYSGIAMTNPTVPEKFTNVQSAPISIGRHSIVGAGALVFPGVTIAQGCAIGALALVNRSTEPWGIYAGAPAKRVKDRSRDLLELEAKYLAE